jgi:hypothetical protein
VEALAVAGVEPVEEASAAGVGEGPEYVVERVFHSSKMATIWLHVKRVGAH